MRLAGVQIGRVSGVQLPAAAGRQGPGRPDDRAGSSPTGSARTRWRASRRRGSSATGSSRSRWAPSRRAAGHGRRDVLASRDPVDIARVMGEGAGVVQERRPRWPRACARPRETLQPVAADRGGRGHRAGRRARSPTRSARIVDRVERGQGSAHALALRGAGRAPAGQRADRAARRRVLDAGRARRGRRRRAHLARSRRAAAQAARGGDGPARAGSSSSPRPRTALLPALLFDPKYQSRARRPAAWSPTTCATSRIGWPAAAARSAALLKDEPADGEHPAGLAGPAGHAGEPRGRSPRRSTRARARWARSSSIPTLYERLVDDPRRRPAQLPAARPACAASARDERTAAKATGVRARAASVYRCQQCGFASPEARHLPGLPARHRRARRRSSRSAPAPARERPARALAAGSRPTPLQGRRDGARATACSPASASSTACSGGGVVRGSLVLIGGDPGIGKSTLLLQAARALARGGAAGALRVGRGVGGAGEDARRSARRRRATGCCCGPRTTSSAVAGRARRRSSRARWSSTRSRRCSCPSSSRRRAAWPRCASAARA